ncbi:hypothetical protein NQ318_004812, partial [Aromia moschata]
NQSTQLFTAPLETDIFEPVALYSEKPQFGLLSSRLLGSMDINILTFFYFDCEMQKNPYKQSEGGSTPLALPWHPSGYGPAHISSQLNPVLLGSVVSELLTMTRGLGLSATFEPLPARCSLGRRGAAVAEGTLNVGKLEELVLPNAKLRFCPEQLQNLNFIFNKKLQLRVPSTSAYS